MCTTIAVTRTIRGAGKGPTDWFTLVQATVGYDHAFHSADEHALLLDFTNHELGTGARVALELDLESGRVLMAQLREAIAAAERSGV